MSDSLNPLGGSTYSLALLRHTSLQLASRLKLEFSNKYTFDWKYINPGDSKYKDNMSVPLRSPSEIDQLTIVFLLDGCMLSEVIPYLPLCQVHLNTHHSI
ncbi:hypothetical protein E2C01_029832 [Portunus trituberculatus]|uniref:Uncharacterized protein n=1 Tax=Portunus trituberculatus TaxID=210409 RepID=A0A5B7ETA0_PORTR|nr:hypothetical protein [Portunus trituberculatus]